MQHTIVDITDIAYQQIKGNYYWAQYGDFKVIMDKSTGYINATKLCSLANTKEGKPKQLSMWKLNAGSEELINEVSLSLGIPRNALLEEPSVSIDLRGTYAHPDLIPHIASWASPVFAVKVSKIVNAQLVREYKETIRAKDTKIDDMQRTLDEIKTQNSEIKAQNAEQTRQINELLNEARESRKEIHQVHEELETTTVELETMSADNLELMQKVDGISTDNAALISKVDAVAKRLDISTEDRAPKPSNVKFTHAYLVYHKPNTRNYRVIRRQLHTLTVGINECVKAGYTKCVYSIYSPNSVSLHVRIKASFPPALGKATLSTFTLCAGKNTKQLVEFINSINVQKKDV